MTDGASARSMNVRITVDDFPQNEANCLTCEQRYGIFCERNKYKATKGYFKSAIGEIGGIIYRCVNYVGRY